MITGDSLMDDGGPIIGIGLESDDVRAGAVEAEGLDANGRVVGDGGDDGNEGVEVGDRGLVDLEDKDGRAKVVLVGRRAKGPAARVDALDGGALLQVDEAVGLLDGAP